MDGLSNGTNFLQSYIGSKNIGVTNGRVKDTRKIAISGFATIRTFTRLRTESAIRRGMNDAQS